MITIKCNDCGKLHSVPASVVAGTVSDAHKVLYDLQRDVSRTCSCKRDPDGINYLSAEFTGFKRHKAVLSVDTGEEEPIEVKLKAYIFQSKINSLTKKTIRWPSFKRVNLLIKENPEVLVWLKTVVAEEKYENSVRGLREDINSATFGLSIENLEKVLAATKALKGEQSENNSKQIKYRSDEAVQSTM